MDRAGVACSMVMGIACLDDQWKGLAPECRALEIGARAKGVAFHCRCQDRTQVFGGRLISIEVAIEVTGHVQDLFAHGVFLISIEHQVQSMGCEQAHPNCRMLLKLIYRWIREYQRPVGQVHVIVKGFSIKERCSLGCRIRQWSVLLAWSRDKLPVGRT